MATYEIPSAHKDRCFVSERDVAASIGIENALEARIGPPWTLLAVGSFVAGLGASCIKGCSASGLMAIVAAFLVGAWMSHTATKKAIYKELPCAIEKSHA